MTSARHVTMTPTRRQHGGQLPRAAVALWLALLAALLAGCTAQSANEAAAPDLDSPPPGAPAPLFECAVDEDCEPAASACCECPSFALPAADGFGQTCADVGCDAPAACPAVQAACIDSACTLRCAAVICELTCDNGFAADSLGCLTCACATAPPQAAECQQDSDCAQVPADCCGCTRGGQDTAVPADQAQAHIDALDCPPDPACPDIDTCEESYLPRCVQGACALAPPAETDSPTPQEPQRCGTTALPPCPQDQVCVLNDPTADQATAAGVGVCRDPDAALP